MKNPVNTEKIAAIAKEIAKIAAIAKEIAEKINFTDNNDKIEILLFKDLKIGDKFYSSNYPGIIFSRLDNAFGKDLGAIFAEDGNIMPRRPFITFDQSEVVMIYNKPKEKEQETIKPTVKTISEHAIELHNKIKKAIANNEKPTIVLDIYENDSNPKQTAELIMEELARIGGKEIMYEIETLHNGVKQPNVEVKNSKHEHVCSAIVKYKNGLKLSAADVEKDTLEFGIDTLIAQLGVILPEQEDIKNVKVTICGTPKKFKTVQEAIDAVTELYKSDLKDEAASNTSQQVEEPKLAQPNEVDDEHYILKYAKEVIIDPDVKKNIVDSYITTYNAPPSANIAVKATIQVYGSNIAHMDQVRNELDTLKLVANEQEKNLNLTRTMMLELERECTDIITRILN